MSERGGGEVSVYGVVVRGHVRGIDEEGSGWEELVALWGHEEVVKKGLTVRVQWGGVAGEHGRVRMEAPGNV